MDLKERAYEEARVILGKSKSAPLEELAAGAALWLRGYMLSRDDALEEAAQRRNGLQEFANNTMMGMPER